MKHTLVVLLFTPTIIFGSPATFSTPDLDRWMYPFNGTPGTRSSGSTFGAPGSPGFDERDAQFLIGFDTTGQISSGQGAANYQINSATLTLRHSGGDFTYDPTQDSYTTYQSGGVDGDAGRPMELFGAGYRNGFDSSSFTESSAFSPPGPPGPPMFSGVRNVFALGFDGGGNSVDVSNSLDFGNNGASGFDPVLFGLGTVTGLNPGDTVEAGMDITFQLNLTSPHVRGFLQQQLDEGWVGLVATSFHAASQGGPAVYPSYDTKENLVGQPGSLSLDVNVIPEPSAVGLLFIGVLVMRSVFRRIRR